MTNEDIVKLANDIDWLKQQAAFLSAQSMDILQRLASLEAKLDLSQRVAVLEITKADKIGIP